MKKVLVTIPEGNVKNTFLPPHVCEYLEKRFAVTWNRSERQWTKETLKEMLPGHDAILTGWGSALLDEEVLAGNDELRLIVHTGGTVGNLVNAFAYDKNIRVLSGNRLYAESVAEGTLAYMLMAQRRIPDYMESVKNGGWRTEGDIWEGLLDKTVGIVGVGTISRFVIQLLQPFRVKIKLFSHHPPEKEFLEKYNCRMASLEEIFSECDIVSVHSALNDENRGLIRREHFELLRDGALFLNTSRGDVVDEAALIAELQKKRFRAVLDVYHEEPLPGDSVLRRMPNVYAVPHMAGPTLDRRAWITKALIDEMESFFAGREILNLEITKELAARMTRM